MERFLTTLWLPTVRLLASVFQASTEVWIMYIPPFIPALIWGITPKPPHSKRGHCNNCPHKWTVNLRQCKTQAYERQSFGSAHCLMASTVPSFFTLSPHPCLFSLLLPLRLASLLHELSPKVLQAFCRVWAIPTGLTGKVNKLLKMKNSAGEQSNLFSPSSISFLSSFGFFSQVCSEAVVILRRA